MAFLLNFTKNELPDMFQQPCPVFNNLITYQRLGKHLLSTPTASEKYTEAPQRFPKKYIGLAQTIIQL